MTYAEKLRDSRWLEKREEVFNYYGKKCFECDKDDLPIEVHHCLYVRGREPWEYDVVHLKPLCRECHESAGWAIEGLLSDVSGMKTSKINELRELLSLIHDEDWSNITKLKEIFGNIRKTWFRIGQSSVKTGVQNVAMD